MGQKCLIWGTPADVARIDDRDTYSVESPRAGGLYKITGTAAAMIQNGYLDKAAKARLRWRTTELIDRRHERGDAPMADSTLLEETKKAPVLSHAKRAERLLQYIAARESSSAGHPVTLGHPIVPEALAHSESWNERAGQITTLLEYLEDKRWLTAERSLDEIQCTVTVLGHEHVAHEEEEPLVRDAFVAMWFDKQMNGAYNKGIRPGIRDAGFFPIRIRREEGREQDRRRHPGRNHAVSLRRGGHDARQ